MVSIFQEKYFFLSNYYLINLKYGNRVYKSVEHLYQTVKCLKKEDREKIRKASTPKSAKILARFIKKRPYWDVEKIAVMDTILRKKFRDPKLKRQLKDTGNMELLNQNYHHDTFWGICGCTKHHRAGLNMLGQILMKIRTEIQ